jgi:proliferating cell nuclear antigen PCNA
MKFIISEKIKKDIFISLFSIIKSNTSNICLVFKDDLLFIQGMDKSHISLFNIHIQKDWFSNYEYSLDENEESVICFDTNTFYNIVNNVTKNQSIVFEHDKNNDYLNINLLDSDYKVKEEYNKKYKLPLLENDYEFLNIPQIDYDCEFLINSKKICDIFSQMIFFGKDINIKCSEDKMDIITDGITGEMRVNIPIDDLCEFSIIEGNELNLKYSLTYINKMCLTNKLTDDIGFSISNQAPMKIKYDLGDNSSIVFFIAPKVNDD